MGVRAPMAPVAVASTTTPVRVPVRVVGVAAIGLGTAHPPTMHPSKHGGEKEHDCVHDAKCEAGLEHGAPLVGSNVDAGPGNGPTPAAGAPCAPVPGGAVGLSDESQEVDGGDEGSDEGEVDERDEHRVGAAAVVGEEGEAGPGKGEDGDDEEDQDVVGRQGVALDVDVDEPGQHAHAWDQSDDLHDAPKGEEDGEQHGGRLDAIAKVRVRFGG